MTSVSPLVDDNGTPIRWKAATILSVIALVVSLVIQVAKAGAKSERLEALTAEVKDLKVFASSMASLPARVEDVGRRQDRMEGKIDKLLERRSR